MDTPSSDSATEIETRWLADSLRLTLREVRSFAATAAAVTARPARLARQWVPPGNYGGHLVIGRPGEDGRIWWPTYAF